MDTLHLPSKLRGAGRVNTDPCGCQYQNCRYIVLCDQHKAEFLQLHNQAAADHRAAQEERQ